MNTKTDLDTAVLHVVRLKGRASSAGIALAIPAEEEPALATLERLAEEGLVIHRTGRVGGWILTPAGRERSDQLVRDERDRLDLGALGGLYDERFLRLNREFKALCTRWQVARGDEAEFGRELERLHAENLTLLKRFGALADRLREGYEGRFRAAHLRFLGGDHNALLQPLTDSYHDVWLELHEDLLLVLDRRREEDD